MRLAEGQVAFRVSLLLLELWTLLAPVQGPPGPPLWRYASSEVVIPKKEAQHGKGFQVPGWLSYSLHFGGQRHALRMRMKKLFWPRHLLVTTQDDQGALQMDYPYIASDCYYLGHLEEIPLSMVTMSTCFGGLKGVMKLDDLAYEIKPLEGSSRFEHIVSQIVADPNITGPTYSLGQKELDPFFSEANISMAPRLPHKVYSSHSGWLRGHCQASHSMCSQFQNDTKCLYEILYIASIVDSILQGTDMKFYLSLLTLYTVRDPADVTDHSNNSPMSIYYRQNFYETFRPHSSLLINKNGPHEGHYDPVIYRICGQYNLLYIGQLERHALTVAIVITNRILRSLGVRYDEPECRCLRRASCIMARYPGVTDAASNCTFGHINNILSGVTGNCIFDNQIMYYNKSAVQARCGNYVVDDHEQCDCGSLKQCHADMCCTTDCRYKMGGYCHIGACCTDCQYSPAGTLCRPIQNTCDLPEYCSGANQVCPTDFYMQDGTPCSEEGYCFQGNCTDREVQCKEIFGASALPGDVSCYDINKEGTRFGFCTRPSILRRPYACGDNNKMCGRLQCANVTHLPRLQDHVGVQQVQKGGFDCSAVGEHRGTETTDVGQVRNGTLCAPGKFCFNAQCNGTVTDLNYNCPPEKCSYRGICNNRRNCHCHVGWDPPRCLRPGSGGSTDSGPLPKRMRKVTQSQEAVLYLQVLFGRIYAFIAALLFGVATNVRNIKTVTVKEATVSEPV
ncbi:disintegrin and metalloproteinase domain-containing protein 20-like [Carlito syrichta]|uniref:Disintegrin and metalloproteinase domain-containing protein 20-like n=1 Tax=Carlito syrichta TaxID=1868482 RepID=A0A3Q0EA85_CARSF|nr:disintegrin and metalloproteinase domain-containing protein 20-like [Carlito syrichta]